MALPVLELPSPPQSPDQNYIVLPPYQSGGPRRRSCRILCTASLVLLAALVYIFWPSDPEVKIVQMHVNRIQVQTISIIAVDISLLVTVKVRNSDVYSMDSATLDVALGCWST
ncbi:hypothetical protein REPUB_Repub13aG0176100 [Reevesia pubescens]